MAIGKTSLIILIGWFFFPSNLQSASSQSTSWRTAQRQGVNALFCYLRARDVECDYNDLVIKQTKLLENGAFSAKTLIQLAGHYGVTINAVSLTMNELNNIERPLIAFMTTDSIDNASFVLLLDAADDDIYYMDGKTGIIHSFTIEEFRRLWSGIALVSTARQKRNWTIFLVGFLACAALTAIVTSHLNRIRKNRYAPSN